MSESILSAAWVSALVAAVGAVISFITYYYNRKIFLITYYYNRKKDRFNSLFHIFTYLDQAAHREARRVIYYYSPIAEKERAAKGKNPRKIDDIPISARIVLGFDIPSVTPYIQLLKSS